MDILSIIPARGGSKGIPGKNLKLIHGKKLLAYTVEASLNSSLVSKTIVTTDDSKILETATKLGAQVIKRPKNLSGDKIGLEPAIVHVLKTLKSNENFVPEIIVTLQNTSPFRTSSHIDGAINLLKRKNYDSVISGYLPKEFLWIKDKDRVKPATYDPSKRPNRQGIKNQFLENGAIYVIKRKVFEKNTKSRISGKVGMYIMNREDSIQIDEPYDLFIAKQFMEWKNSGKNK